MRSEGSKVSSLFQDVPGFWGELILCVLGDDGRKMPHLTSEEGIRGTFLGRGKKFSDSG